MIDPNEEKRKFLEMYSQIQRDGSTEMMKWLEKSDFFTAPASTRFHGSCPGGLVAHSNNVCRRLMAEMAKLSDNIESIVLVSLLHDVCKANFYKAGTRNVKNPETGIWEAVPSYSIEDNFPMGHGEKSVFIINQFMKLTVEEALAIRWHMGGFDDAVKGGSYSMGNAYEMYQLALLLHVADMKATYLDEKEVK